MEKRNTISRGGLVVVLVWFFWLLPSVAKAATIQVDCSGSSLQAALDVAVSGDIVEVINGSTCNENVTIRTNITLDGLGTATIDGGPGATTTTVQVTSRGVTIIGFTITGGRNGIHVLNGATAEIDSNNIESVGTNGILVSRASSVLIINNTIQNNLNGSGIIINDSSAARIGFTGPPPCSGVRAQRYTE